MKSFTKFQFAFIILYGFSFVYSQNIVVKGVVTDSLKVPLPYVDIGICNKYLGTITDDKGNFRLYIDNSMVNDTLKISCLGYKSKKIPIKKIQSNSKINIVLSNKIEMLSQVVLTSKNTKLHVKGKKKSNSKKEVYFAISKAKNRNLGAEIGRKFSIGSKKPSLLREFKFFIKKNNFDKIKFRINIYTIKDKLPFRKINRENILVELKNKFKGWARVNLTDYDIIIQQDIIITAQWIEGSKNGDELALPILIPSFSSVHYYRYGFQSKWKKYNMISTAMVLKYKQ